MKNIKLILKIVAFVFMLWAIKHIVSTDDSMTGDKESPEIIVGIDKDVDAQVKAILSGDVIETSIDSGDDFSFSSGFVLSGQECRSVNAVYEKEDSNLEISLPAIGMVVTIKLNNSSVGEYSLSDSENRLSFFDGDKFINHNDGVVIISAVSDGSISGSFKSGELVGKFTDILPTSKVAMEGKIAHINILYFNKATGATKVEKVVPSEFYYDSSLTRLRVKGDSDKDFTEDIDKIEITSTAVILHVAGDEIDFITIDKLNSNQITIQYKSGDNMVLL